MSQPTVRKGPTNLSLPDDLVKKAREQKWLQENRPALLAWNDWIVKNGMPYDAYRHF